jgi:hypothetical protein
MEDGIEAREAKRGDESFALVSERNADDRN